MHSFVFLLIILGVFVSLAIQYSFWVAIGIMQLSGMFVVVVTAFLVSGTKSKVNRPKFPRHS